MQNPFQCQCQFKKIVYFIFCFLMYFTIKTIEKENTLKIYRSLFKSENQGECSSFFFFFTVFVELISTLRLCNGARPQVSFLTRRCFCRFELHVNRSLQPAHSYNLIPSCASSWRLWSAEDLNDFPQWEHLNGFSPVWSCMWVRRICLFFKTRPHVSHVNVSLATAPSAWFFMCLLYCSRVQKRDSQRSHE